MTKYFLVLLILLIVTVSPALASKEDNRGKSPKWAAESSEVLQSGEECDPDDEWENHGQYVSCVARMQDRDEDDVREAAKSDIGKKVKNSTPSISLTPTLSATPSSTPTPTISATPSASPTLTSTDSAQITEDTRKAQIIELKALIEVLKDILESLKHLI